MYNSLVLWSFSVFWESFYSFWPFLLTLEGLFCPFQEVVKLTQELLGTKTTSASRAEQSEEPATADAIEETEEETKHDWIIGENCMAIWSKDGG